MLENDRKHKLGMSMLIVSNLVKMVTADMLSNYHIACILFTFSLSPIYIFGTSVFSC